MANGPKLTKAERQAQQAANRKAHGSFATREEAEQHKPGTAKWRLFVVTMPDGQTRYTWADGNNHALQAVAKAAGWQVAEEGKRPTADKVASLFGLLSAEDRAALLAQLTDGKAATPAATTGRKGGK